MKNIGKTTGVTPSDTTVLNFNMFLVTSTSGDVSVGQQDGSIVTLPNVPVGVWIPCGNGKTLRATGTTAVGLLVV